MLATVGFDQNFIGLIHQCISTVRYSLLFNGSKSSYFTPSRGIRQGDPLSPYLFILCIEVLARLISRVVEVGRVSGISVASSAPKISQLFYADDVLLLCGAKISEVGALLSSVDKFCSWTGMSISKDKSDIFVSKGVHSCFSRQVKDMWGFKQLPKYSKYLGVLLFLSLNKSKDFVFVKEKLEARISGWKGKCLSQMGRTTLIKSVAMSAPIYAMSAFKLPKRLCSSLDAMIRKFWWNPKK